MIHSNTGADPLAQLQQVLDAAVFAAGKHSSQRRKGAAAEPYINHLLEVAGLVAHSLSNPDKDLVVAALLHDVIEDAGVQAAELAERFGQDVAALVLEVTDDKSLPQAERKRLQVLTAPKKSVRAQMIKLADKISNLQSMIESPPIGWSVERRLEYVAWAEEVINGLTAPPPALKAEFDAVVKRFRASVRTEAE